MIFINRDAQLRLLEKEYGRGRSCVFMVSGSRGCGKTELVKRFLAGKKHIYFSAGRCTERENLRMFSRKLAHYFRDNFILEQKFTAWNDAFKYIHDNALQKNPLVIVIDNFHYIAGSSPDILHSALKFRKCMEGSCPVLMILAGSGKNSSYKENHPAEGADDGLNYRHIAVEPFKFTDIAKIFKGIELTKDDTERILISYFMLGGTISYWANIFGMDSDNIYPILHNAGAHAGARIPGVSEPGSDIFKEIIKKITKKNTYLCNAVDLILKEDIEEPRFYYTILASIARGNDQTSTLFKDTGLGRGILSKYTGVLENLGIVSRKLPITKDPAVGRNAKYFINDNFLNFWFNFIFPYMSEIGQGNYDLFESADDMEFEKIRAKLNNLINIKFKDTSFEIVDYMNKRGILPFRAERIDRWWDRTSSIDIAAFNTKRVDILFCDCFWIEDVGFHEFLELKKKSRHLRWYNNERTEYFMLFAKSFNRQFLNYAKKYNIQCIDTDNIMRLIFNRKH